VSMTVQTSGAGASPMRNVIINADDYAMDEGVDAAILKLASLGSISAASAMVLSPRWEAAARATHDAAPLSWGLHLDLTSPFASGIFASQGLTSLMFRALSGSLDPAAVRRDADRQLSLFEAGRKAAPDFIDGHQHVHQLPVIRDVLLEELHDRYGGEAKRIGLRICKPQLWRGVKAAIIGASGASRLSQLAETYGHPVNSDFAGVYNFASDANLAAYWQNWVRSLAGPLPLIMCHVAIYTEEGGDSDPIRAARLREFAYLASEEFHWLCRQYEVDLQPWPPA
jgi:chitin disaccharide deacetylase